VTKKDATITDTARRSRVPAQRATHAAGILPSGDLAVIKAKATEVVARIGELTDALTGRRGVSAAIHLLLEAKDEDFHLDEDEVLWKLLPQLIRRLLAAGPAHAPVALEVLASKTYVDEMRDWWAPEEAKSARSKYVSTIQALQLVVAHLDELTAEEDLL